MSSSDSRPVAAYRYKFDNIEYDDAAVSLCIDGLAVSLEPRPLRLLAELLRHVNEVVTKEELFESVWDGRPTVDNVFANAVTKLRKALGETAAKRIVNVPRIGYRFVGPVERVAVSLPAAPELHLQAGQSVPGRDSYLLERSLGSTGRGNVWLARHAKMKTPHVFKFANDADQLRQIKREFTLGRVLQHELGDRPEFVHAIDSNFRTPPFFIESEYGGTDLLAWAVEANRLSAMPQAERLALFLQIARAVAAAHSVGVLHKDIKPSNILISGEPGAWVAKLADFGSGRAMDLDRLRELGLTAMGLTLTDGASGDSIGSTAMYLAPEVLAGGAPSTQSDVYALGLMLFQLTVGDMRRPMVTGWGREIADELLGDDIRAATEGSLAHRLSSAAALLERVSALEQRRKDAATRTCEAESSALAATLLQRNRARRPWLIAAIASLVVGLSVSLWFQAKASNAFRHANRESLRAKTINDFLNQDVLAAADVIRVGPAKPVTMLDVLRKSAQRASVRFKDKPLSEAAVRHQLAKVFFRLASPTDAAREYDAAIALRTPLVKNDDDELLTMRFERVNLLLYMSGGRQKDLDIAQAAFAAATADARPEQLSAATPLAFAALRALEDVLESRNDFPGALAAAQRMVATASSANDLDEDFKATALGALAQIHTRMGRADLAQKAIAGLGNETGSISRAEAIVIARTSMRIGNVLLKAHRWRDAEAVLVTAREKLLKSNDPSELHIGDLTSDIGHVFKQEGDFDKAAQNYAAALIFFKSALGDDHQYTRITASNLAAAYVELGRFLDALRIYKEHRPWFNAHATGGRWVPLEVGLARTLIELGRTAEALDVLKPLPMPADGSTTSTDEVLPWQVQGWKAIATIQQGRGKEGIPLLEAAVARMQRDDLPAWSVAPYTRWLARAKASH